MPAPMEPKTFRRLVRLAVDFDGAPIRRRDAAKYLHQGRLAGAVFADQADHLARPNLHRKIRERHDAGIGFRYSVELRNGSSDAMVGREETADT